MRAALSSVVAAVLLGPALVACTGSDPPPAAPSTPSTPLAAYDTAGVSLARAAFCRRIPDSAVEDALGSESEKSSRYGNGERFRLDEGARDVAHEFGCTHRAGDGTTARAWLFAPPVTAARSRDLVAEARATAGCRPDEDAPKFGSPSVALVCDTGSGTEASYRGLFVDSWLTCSVTGAAQDDDLLLRAGRWCVQVAEATRLAD